MLSSRTPARWFAVAVVLASLIVSARVRALCPGDCNGDGIVTVDELLRTIDLALGAGAYRLCPPTDMNGDREFTIDELVGAVSNALTSCPDTVQVYRAPALTEPTGPLSDGRGVLPNGRRVEPAGLQVSTQTLPLNVALTPDGRYLFVTNDGYSDADGRQYVQVIDTETLAVTKVDVPQFFGLGVTPEGDRVFVGSDSDSGPDRIDALHLSNGTLVRDEHPFLELPDNTFPSGLAVSPDGTHLYVVGLRTNAFLSVDLGSRAVHEADKEVGNLPYSVVVARDGLRAYVSAWGLNNGNPPDFVPAPLPPLDPNRTERSSVVEIDLSNPDAPHVVHHVPIGRSLRLNNKTVYGGSHPSAMQLSPDGTLLYVTATNVDLLVVLDTATMRIAAEVDLNTFDDAAVPEQLQGLYPNALAVSADGRRVYVADAGINAVQVIDVDPAARTFRLAGFIPTGWYPTALALSADSTRLYVANGKGAAAGANGGPEFERSGARSSYIGEILKGSVSIIDAVDRFDLADATARVVANNGFTAAAVRWVDGAPHANEVERGHPLPIDYGSGPSDLIQYVVFIFKENRTYDQIFGSLPGGNGDPDLEFFGEEVTPNQHALAREFAIGDNFFNDGEVSTLGHEWADQGNCTDFTEKMWPSNYDRNLPGTVLETGQEGFTKGGFIFEALERQGIPFRIYGETLGLLSRFAAGSNGGGVGSIALPVTQAFPGRLPTVDEIFTIVNGDIETLRPLGVNVDILKTQVWPNQMLEFPSNIIADKTDAQRAALFQGELDGFIAAGRMPNYIHIWLPNDHTFGGGTGAPTPRSAVADNDAGVGRIVEALTHSPFWPRMAIFITEDDPQGGVDHVSAHRTFDLVISPYVKRGYVSHVHHSGLGLTKTMWLLLGAQPLSLFDRYATDMRDYFTTTPDLTPYVARPRQIPVEVNPARDAAPNIYLRRAAERTAGINLKTYDEDGEELSRIIELVHVGQQAERNRPWAVALALAMVITLISGGALAGRHRAAALAG